MGITPATAKAWNNTKDLKESDAGAWCPKPAISVGHHASALRRPPSSLPLDRARRGQIVKVKHIICASVPEIRMSNLG